jgi:hypothetical protein
MKFSWLFNGNICDFYFQQEGNWIPLKFLFHPKTTHIFYFDKHPKFITECLRSYFLDNISKN